MVKVIEEYQKPVAQVRCHNCGSLLEYGNADLHARYDDSTMLTAMRFKSHFIWCPVCNCEVNASLIPKPEKGGQYE